jgi:hypothetical protein
MMDFIDWIGIVGFGLSSILGAIKVRDRFFKKPKLEVQFENDPTIDSGVYRTELQFVESDGTVTGVFRKYLKVRVLNRGSALAHRCKAEIRIMRIDSREWVPADKPLQLIWNGRTYEKDIGINGREPLAVLISDSRLQTALPEEGKPYALAATLESYDPSSLIRMQDGLGYGRYEGTITVRCDEGVIAQSRFEITVGSNWHSLEMKQMQLVQ